jgi:hypothetical protein
MFILAEKIKAGLSQLDPFNKGNNTKDPLTNLKSVTRWVESLAVGDVVKSQNAILLQLKRFNENLSLATKEQLAVLMFLDEKSQDLQDTLVQQYLRTSRMSRTVESQLWHAINGLYWEIARSYHVFVMEFARNAKNHPNEALMPLVTVRAIRTLSRFLKWRAIRYLQPGQNIWMGLHRLYLVAETHGFHQSKITAYPQSALTTTCESTYLHVLLFDLANTGTLYPRQLNLVDQWLANWSGMLTLDSQLYLHQHSFATDLSADHAARRVRNPAADKPMRYWGTAKLSHRIEAIQIGLREGTAPVRLGLTEDSRVAESIELLDYLQRQWSPLATREQRRMPRERVKHMVEISHGFSNIINQTQTTEDLATNLYGDNLVYMEADDVAVYGFVTERTRNHTTKIKKLRPGVMPEVERWIMQDESPTGYGAVVDTRNKSWLRVGALIAAKPREDDIWRLGVVRRLFRLDEESSSVGIEIFTETLHVVTLQDKTAGNYTVGNQENTGAPLPYACLWLDAGDGIATLVIDPAQYHVRKVLEIQGIENVHWIALGHPVERGEGWIRVSAEVVEHES